MPHTLVLLVFIIFERKSDGYHEFDELLHITFNVFISEEILKTESLLQYKYTVYGSEHNEFEILHEYKDYHNANRCFDYKNSFHLQGNILVFLSVCFNFSI